jgi:hypothetical protein
VYRNHRTQHTEVSKPQRRSAKPPTAFHSDASNQPAAAMSPARLAAEAAFATPALYTESPSQAQVTVRKGRMRVGAAPAQPASDRSAEPALGRARVFRVEALRTTSGLPESVASLPGGLPAQAAISDTAPVPRERPHQATAKRPGPVTHVVLASPAIRETPAAEPTLDTMEAELSGVGQMLEAAQQARSLEIVDRRMDALWQELSRQADDILRDIQAQLR